MGAAAGADATVAEVVFVEGVDSCTAVAYGRRTADRRKRHWPHMGRILGCSIVPGRKPLATEVQTPSTGTGRRRGGIEWQIDQMLLAHAVELDGEMCSADLL